MDIIEWVICSLGYFFVGGITFKTTANKSDHPSEPFEKPGPTFAGIFWPIALPFALGSKVPVNPNSLSKADKRRAEELKEAEHRKKVASMNAEALAIAERGVDLDSPRSIG